MSLLKDEYTVKLSEHEMFLILEALEKRIARAFPDKPEWVVESYALWGRLTDIYEERV